MSSVQRLFNAFRLQFQWVTVLITDPSRYSNADRKRCVVFAVMHACFVLILFLHVISFLASCILAFVMQGAALCLAIFHMGFIEEYASKKGNALDTERLVNTVIVGEIAVRCFCALHCILMSSYTFFLLCLVELLYDVVATRNRSLLLDATTIWKEIHFYSRDSQVRIGFQVVLTVYSVIHLMLKMSEM